MELTEALIEGAIDSITGFITARAAKQFDLPIAEVMDVFLSSRTYRMLCDKETGLYWDSLPEIFDMFRKEISA